MVPKCLACWNEISERKVCPHCGSHQEEVRDYLSLSILTQQNRTEEIPEDSKVVNFLKEIDPDFKPEKKEETFQPPQTTTQKPSLYSPTTLKTPTTQEQQDKKTIICPHCNREVRDKKYCKYCGNPLKKECPECGEYSAITIKFCSKCGHSFD